jgi:hypothetical protein
VDWLLLLIGMTAQGGWTVHQIPFQSKELCETAMLQIEQKADSAGSLSVFCVQTQDGYGSFRKGEG